ncbi:uncharacterized protein ATNIH1004_001330 [Aspergillus tanneri]|uniref:Uncharacterized protein n=1 Tax=Aspergillus tanneri TaxID=1220188 RepID=A0A5M9N290_9EURO|nr:uncharacterized protein ATNIH1004_001330 [Aspergillus tanneri]KAA8652426.1 hypothetical protein ATNIH1004_001330 [Aspergillus tanneri]
MGRKKSRTARRAEPQWEIDDEHRMLGCLDAYIDKDTSGKDVLSNYISKYLQETRGKNFAVDRVREKLQQLQEFAVRNGRRKSIFSSGSRVLRNVGVWDFTEIHKHKDDVTGRITATIIDKGRRFRPTPSRATSCSISSNRGASAQVQASGTPTPTKRKLKSCPPSRSSLRIKKIKLNSEIEETRRPPVSPTRKLGKSPQNSRLPSEDSIIGDSGDSNGDDGEDAVKLLQVPAYSQKADRETMGEITFKEELEMLRQKCTEEVRALEIRLNEERAMHKLQLNEEMNKLRQAEKTLASVRLQYEETSLKLISLERTQAEVEQGIDGELINKLKYQEERINFLEPRLRETQDSVSFAGLSPDDSFGPKESTIQNAMSRMHTSIRNSMDLLSRQGMLCSPDVHQNSDTQSLLCRSLGLDLPLLPGPLPVDLGKLGLEAVLRATAAAALCEWVFKNESEATIAGGQLTVRNLDLAAHRSLFKSEAYLEIQVPFHAGTLATRLFNALDPLIQKSGDSSTPDPDGFPRPLNADERNMVIDGFTDIFRDALTLKADLLASTCQYALAFFSPLSEYMGNIMEAETREGCRISNARNGSLQVQLCILPAIFTYGRDGLELPGYKIPVVKTLDDLGNHALNLLYKAVVIT